MRNLEEAQKVAREIISEDYDITCGEIDALHSMNEWDKIITAFNLGVTAGAKSVAPAETELIEALQKLPEDKLMDVKNYAEDLLLENAMDRFRSCRRCGSEDLATEGRFVVCQKCGAGGGCKIDSRGRVRLFWNYEGNIDN